MSHIKELFPKPIYVVENICVNLIPQFCSIIYDVIDKKGSKTTDFQYVESTHSTFDDFYNIKQFEPLVKEIQNHSYNFLLALGYSDEQISKMKLRNLWANIDRKSVV